MQGPQQQYTNEIKDKFGYYATWNPGITLSIGDIGVLKNNVFTKISSLSNEDFKIQFDITEDTTTTDIEYSSEGSVSLTTKLAGAIPALGSVLTNADVGISLEFSKANSTYFKLANTLTNSLSDPNKIGNQIIKLFQKGDWSKEWVVITELIVARSGTIVISNASNSKLELKANANLNVNKIDVADGSFDFSTQFSKGLNTKIISQSGLTPMFKVMGLQHKGFLGLGSLFFGSRSLEPLDQVTPNSAKDKHKDDLFFGVIEPALLKKK